jgi:hypothetical protein
MKKFSTKNVIGVELVVTILPLLYYYLSVLQGNTIYPEFSLNIIFIVLLITLFIFRSRSIRHMYLGFGFLILGAFGSILDFKNFAYIASSMTLILFFIGIVNFLIFNRNN